MLILYDGTTSVCAIKVRLALAEKGLEFKSRNIDLRKGEQFAADYLNLNPNAVVPTLVDNDEVILEMYNEKPIGIQLPKTLSFIVNETEAVVKGQTAASSNKPAILENGIRVMVPPFIEQGEKIEINTEDLSYSKRVD